MQTVMLRLDALIRRRRGLFLGVWALVVLAALPFAARQSEHLTGGGFDVPGSQSVAVQQAVERDFDTRRARRSPPCSSPHGDATTAELRSRAERGRHGRRRRRRRRAHAGRPRAGAAQLQADGPRTLVVPLTTDVGDCDAIDVAVDLRKQLGIADQPPTRRSRSTSSARARCGRACRTSRRRTSRRPSRSASRSCC